MAHTKAGPIPQTMIVDDMTRKKIANVNDPATTPPQEPYCLRPTFVSVSEDCEDRGIYWKGRKKPGSYGPSHCATPVIKNTKAVAETIRAGISHLGDFCETFSEPARGIRSKDVSRTAIASANPINKGRLMNLKKKMQAK